MAAAYLLSPDGNSKDTLSFSQDCREAFKNFRKGHRNHCSEACLPAITNADIITMFDVKQSETSTACSGTFCDIV